jgi:hypothetical protein
VISFSLSSMSIVHFDQFPFGEGGGHSEFIRLNSCMIA